jgi:indolepyruvate ferredoxin oxidoreductase alpha subunit
MLVVVLDNSSTAMTGGQENPGTGVLISDEIGTRVKIEEIAKGCGILPENIWVQESNDLPVLMEKFKEAVVAKGVRVFISRHVCSLIEIRQARAKKIKLPVIKVDPDKCIGCQLCFKKFGCPAINFNFEEKKAFINQNECRSCKVCIDVCLQEAFYLENE